MQELDDLLAKCGFVKQGFVGYDFQAIEESIGFGLPDDYKYYLNNYEPFEDFIGEQYLSLYSFDNITAFNTDIEEEDKSSASMLIGSNGASESVGLHFLGARNYRAVIAQFMYDVDDYIEVGTSFTDMIKRLYDGIEWFKE